MPLIRIQERPGGPDGSNAVVSFNNGPEYFITISDPFKEKEEQELACTTCKLKLQAHQSFTRSTGSPSKTRSSHNHWRCKRQWCAKT
jgi:hypothetical protein